MANIKEHPNALLLVEGNDDFHVIHALCKRLGIDVRNLENANGGQFGIVDCKGFENLQLVLPVRFKQSNLRTIGIVVDVRQLLSELEDLGHHKYAMVHKPKALLHTWLALQDDPGMPMGRAITKKVLNTEDALCLSFVNWVRRLFENN